MSEPIPNEWHRLFNAALNDTLTPEEHEQLAALLKTSAEARQLWFLYHDNECGLAELKPRGVTAPTPTTAKAGRRVVWSPWMAAAAGLAFGLFSASMVWGYVGAISNRVTTLFTESFENGPAPRVTGFPTKPDEWSGDFSEVVGDYRGMHPLEGRKMLRFRRADYEGKPVLDGYVADLFRIVDLHGAATGGNASAAIEAHFASLPQGELHGLSCGVTIYALDALPPAGMRDDAFLKRASAGLTETSDSETEPRILASATHSQLGPNDGQTWSTVRSELRLPAEARYCVIHLRAHLRGSDKPQTPKPVEFAGLFLDDVQLTLTRQAPLR